MRVYPQRSLGIGQYMSNDCTCGHCRLAHVKRESNTARVYKMQLPVKTKKAKTKPKKAVQPKVIYGYQNAPKKKKSKTPVYKSVVRSKPEYDAWYFSDADLHTIAHSNMDNYLSRFQCDLQEAATQTSLPRVRSPKPGTAIKAASKDAAAQIWFSDKEVKNSFNSRHKDRGDSPSRRRSPVALSALMNYKASGDSGPTKPNDNLHFNTTRNQKMKSNLEPASGKIISLPHEAQSDLAKSRPKINQVSDFEHLFKSHKAEMKSNPFKPLPLADFDDFKSPFPTELFHSKSKNLIKDLLDLERYRLPRSDVGNYEKPTHRREHDKTHKPHNTENHRKLTRKLLESSLEKEKQARRSLKIENEGLKTCISKAEQKVRDVRSSLAELSKTIRAYKAKSGLPCASRVEKLEKLVDELIREFRSSAKDKTEVCGSPRTPAANNHKDVHANYVVISTGSPRKDWNKVSVQKNEGVNDKPPVIDHLETFDWSNLSCISSGIASRVSVSSATTSLTALKKELGQFFEDMREDTEKLIEEAQIHHEALMSYSERTSSVPTYDSTSTISTV